MFVFSIMFWIISPNVMRMLLGWNGLGFVSYLLVFIIRIWSLVVLVCWLFCRIGLVICPC